MKTKTEQIMIYLTFYHSREIFVGHKFAPWVVRLFPNGVKFEGTRSGNYEPTISVTIADFEDARDIIPTRNLIRIRGEFNLMEQLVYGARNFDNSIKKATP